MSNVQPLFAQIDPVTELQKEFCIFGFNNQIRIGLMSEIQSIKGGTREADINMFALPDGKLWMRRHLETLPVPSKPSQVIEAFLVDPSTQIYREIAFTPASAAADVLNYWVPPVVKPKVGSWTLIAAFLREIICADNSELYEYLLNFIAHMLQKPQEKPGVMLVMLGGQGTGKGTFFKLLRKIWERTTLDVSRVDYIVGGFNGSVERNFLVCMDEALFSQDRKSMDQLKSIITEDTITIEQKHQPRRTVRSIHRFFAASNHEHFGNIEKDDRRFVFLRVSDRHKGKLDYFKMLHDAIDDPAQLSAMVFDLCNRNISQFNVRSKPKTPELMEQKLQSLVDFERYWFEVLSKGCFSQLGLASGEAAWTSERFVSSSEVENGFKNHQAELRRYQTIQGRKIHAALKRLCPSATKKRGSSGSIQQRGYQLPPLDEARLAFETILGGKNEWDDW